MDSEQLLWGVLWGLISFLFVTILFFVKNWISNLNKDIDKMELKLDSRVKEDTCKERHEGIKKESEALFKHKHSNPGGEVIIP